MCEYTAYLTPLRAAPLRGITHATRSTPSCCRKAPRDAALVASRRELLHSAVVLCASTIFSLRAPEALAAGAPAASLENELVPVVMCRTVLNPVRRYISEAQWDRSRTNVNYCTRILRLRKSIRGAAEFLEGDAYYDAMDLAAEIDINMTQLDATVYTPLFMPGSDDGDGVSIEQRKFQNEAFAYYDTIIGYFDDLFSKMPPAALERARDTASTRSFEITVEPK